MALFDVNFATLQIPAVKHLTNAIRNASYRDELFPVKVAEALEALAERRIRLKGDVSIPLTEFTTIFAPSIDETDIGWYAGPVTSMDNMTDPITLLNVPVVGQSRFGMTTNITNPGQGYSTITLTVTDALGNTNGASLSGVLSPSGGALVQVVVNNSGFGLALPLTVTVMGDGTGAAVDAFIGRQFNSGDLVVFNNPTVSNGQYSYEISLITNIVWHSATSADFTLSRTPSNAVPGFAQMGSPKATQTGMNFWRLIPKILFDLTSPIQGPGVEQFDWRSVLIPAIQVNVPPTSSNPAIPAEGLPQSDLGLNQTGEIFNLMPPVSTAPNTLPPCPGLRVPSGNAYLSLFFSGPLTVGQTLDKRVKLSGAWESIRVNSGFLRTAAVGATPYQGHSNATVVAYLFLISPNVDAMGGPLVGWIDTLIFDSGKLLCYDGTLDLPITRMMPRHQYWQPSHATQFDYPPNVLPLATGALDANGNLQLGWAIVTNPMSGPKNMIWTPDSFIDGIIFQVGSTTAGSDLGVEVEC